MEAPNRTKLYQRQFSEPAPQQQPRQLHDLQPAAIAVLLRERDQQRWQRAAEAVTAQSCRVA